MRRYIGVMEMTFPHSVAHRDVADSPQNHREMLAAAIARQANSRTARAVMLAARENDQSESFVDDIKQRILYFGAHKCPATEPSGPFWAARGTKNTVQTEDESNVYQDASKYFKAHALESVGTGEQFNLAGHGATRTL